MVFEVSWSSKITPRFLTELDGVIVEEPNWIVKSCCRAGVTGKREDQSLSGWAEGDVLSSTPRCPPGSLRSVAATVGSLGQNERYAVCHQIAMVGETMCLYDWTQWCRVWEKRRGPRTEPWGTPVTNWCALDTSSSPDPPWKTDTVEIGFKPAKCNPSDIQWCPVMREWTGGSDG